MVSIPEIRKLFPAAANRAAALALITITAAHLFSIGASSRTLASGTAAKTSRPSADIETAIQGDMKYIPGNSIDEYLKSAAANSPSLRAAFYEWKSAASRIPEVSSLPDPVFSYGYFIESIETRVGPQRQRFGIRQMLPWFGKRGAARDTATEEAGAAYARFEARKFDLFFRVRKAYLDYYLVGRKIEATRSSLSLLESWERVARVRYESSIASRSDLIRVEIERERIKERLAGFEAEKAPVLAEIRNLLDLPGDVDLPVPHDMAAGQDSIDGESFRQKILGDNPELISMEHILKRDGFASALARKRGYPDFVLGLEYIDTDEALNPAMEDSGKDPWIVTMSFDLPLWFGKYRAARQSAAAREKKTGYELKNRKNELLSRAERVLFEFGDARRKFILYRDSLVPMTGEALAIAFKAYEGGEAVFSDLVNIQRDLLDMKLELEKFRIAMAVKYAEAQMLAGGEL